MNAFDGLLPPPVASPPLPDRGGPSAARDRARARRRTRATRTAGAGCALSLVLTGVVALRSPEPRNGIEVVPDATPSPVPVASATAGSRPAEPPSLPGVSGPGGTASLPVVTSRPSGTSAASGAATRGPAEPTASAPAPRGVTRIDRSVVTDHIGEHCDVMPVAASGGLCLKFGGPWEMKAGTPVEVLFDFCARVADTTVRFAGSSELHVRVSEETTPRWDSVSDDDRTPHDVAVAQGTCLSYVAHWDGRASDGSVLPPGRYQFTTWLLQESTRGEEPFVNSGFVVTVS